MLSQDQVQLDALQNQHRCLLELGLCNGPQRCWHRSQRAASRCITALTEGQVGGVLSKEGSEGQGMLVK